MIFLAALIILIVGVVAISGNARSGKYLDDYRHVKSELNLKHNYGADPPPLTATRAPESPPALPKSKLRILKSQEDYKRALNLCSEYHFTNVEQSMIVIGGVDGIENRGYSGETRELSEKILADLEEGYLASSVIGKMVEDEYNGSSVQKEQISDLLAAYRDLNQQTEQNLYTVENAWEIIAEKLETTDQSFKQTRLRIAALEEQHLQDGILPITAKSWTERAMPMVDEVFELSKNDPLGTLRNQLVVSDKHFESANQIIGIVEEDRKFFKSWITNNESTMEQRGFKLDWLKERLTEIQINFSGDGIKSLGELKENIMNLSELVDTYHAYDQRINHDLPGQIEDAKLAISKACGMEKDMAFGQGKFSSELEDIHDMLEMFKEGIESGDITYAEKCSEKIEKSLHEVTGILSDIQETALSGRNQLDEVKQKFNDLCKDLDAESKAFHLLLQHTQPSVFHRDIMDYMEKSERIKSTLEEKITEVENSLITSRFFDAIDEFDHLELRLERLEKTLFSLKQAQQEVHEIRSKNESMMESIVNRYKEAYAKHAFIYISGETTQLYTDVKKSITIAMEKWEEAKHAEENQLLIDPRETASSIQHANHAVDSLLQAISADKELYEFLQTKVHDIGEIVLQAKANVETAKQDGIENSVLTDELITSIHSLLQGWPDLKEKLHDPQQDWSQLRFEYDVFFHGIDSINARLADDLNLAKEASDKIEAASEELNKISAWRGESGLTIELTECSKIIHTGLQALNRADYKTVISQAKLARIEMRQKLHQARKIDTKFQIDDSWVRTRPLGKHVDEPIIEEPKKLNHSQW